MNAGAKRATLLNTASKDLSKCCSSGDALGTLPRLPEAVHIIPKRVSQGQPV